MTQFYKISILFFCVSIIHFSYSQSFEHRKFKYDWSDEIRLTLSQSERYKNYDAVILHEETTLDVDVRNIKRYQVIQFNTQAAIDKYNLFRVPIVMDPHLANLENNHKADSASFPKLLLGKINFFDARIIRNGEFVKAVLDEVAYRREERIGESLLPFYVHYFYVRNLEPGDQLEVIISHEWPLYIFHYYLNERIPKQEAYITINNAYLGRVNVYSNSLVANLKSYEKSVDDKTHLIVYEDLDPVDPDMPTKVYGLPKVEMFLDKTTEASTKIFGTTVIDTLTWEDVLYKSVTRIDPGEARSWETYDDQSYKTTLFYQKLRKMAPDTMDGAHFMSFIQEYVADKLGYKNDFNYFIHEEHGFPDIGTYLQNGIFREAFKTSFYYQMIDRINEPYYRSHLQDRRIFCIDTSQVSPLYRDHVAYWMFDRDSVPYVFFPKSHRFGWYANEVPFYFTGENQFLVPQTVPRKIYDNEIYLIQYPVMYINPLPYNLNKKKVKASVNISLADLKTAIQSEVSLSGQFSTITRGYYQYGWMDSTISSTYYADLCKKNPETEIKLISSQKKSPFAHLFSLNVPTSKNVFSTIDGEYVIDLADLIFMHYEMLDTNYFKAPFRHDFQGKEEFDIELNFDQLVSIQDMESYNHEMLTGGLFFSSRLIKLADNQYGLKIVWEIMEDYTSVNDLHALQDAFKLMRDFSRLKLKVKIQ